MDGIINIYKEKGFTSHDVVAKLRGILKQKKIGHTGTLDPDAEGVLPVCLGKATKLCDLLTDKDKCYETVLKLGLTTDTQDMTGQVLSQHEVQFDEAKIREVILSFEGEYDQIPPMYSALKVNGKKLYELAREGKEVERKPRRVVIHEINILSMDPEQGEVRMRVFCSKGTYIRTLCHDIGAELLCGGAMKDLLRTKVDRFLLEDSIKLSKVEALVKQDDPTSNEKIEDYIIPVDAMFPQYRIFYVNAENERFLYNGNELVLSAGRMEEENSTSDFVKMYDSKGDFKALYQITENRKCIKPVKMFL